MRIISNKLERLITIELSNYELNELVASYCVTSISQREEIFKKYNVKREATKINDSFFRELKDLSDFKKEENKNG